MGLLYLSTIYFRSVGFLLAMAFAPFFTVVLKCILRFSWLHFLSDFSLTLLKCHKSSVILLHRYPLEYAAAITFERIESHSDINRRTTVLTAF